MRNFSIHIVVFTLFVAVSQTVLAGTDKSETYVDDTVFKVLFYTTDPAVTRSALDEIEKDWSPAYIPQLLESARFAASRRVSIDILELLQRKTGEDIGDDLNGWYQWLWNQNEQITPAYADFKADLYRQIDPKFEKYFADRQDSARIRLDEIRWGGVVQDGIPPLRYPEMLSASDADYLDDDNIVFGIEINGDARAYPKRILAWHEMFVDDIGGVNIAGVYCTLCGTVIPYVTEFDGVQHKLGTSGFLYRSNKLMYDEATQSLWNTIKGEPVLGPLAGKGIALKHLSVVTTTWGNWKKRHPETTVLSLDTGHYRDYGEGIAYQEYFSTDRLMFNTPFQDKRLKNKQEVLALRFQSAPEDQLAIDTEFLNRHPIYSDQVGFQKLVVLTDDSGANRVYDPEGVEFASYDRASTLKDKKGGTWRLTEEALIAGDGRKLNRLPYHRAFWFGWHATYPKTRLVK
ncbi:DUF3179 domain-containing protein [Kordiimonas sp. SCSIO 12610]|uniref:DUF3179 domain-containing protein n=1 Tax=Kordiimonas sp. SCSIO 12610 TaxID=2829597 RepID=UPI00210B933A|nr:DUF3179 domain-containing protein [Kordiimonas sp. SCSIO 12610]UTW54935.1 DUF3179 domain-containing protein [Kordiimonas sp. SCSIO 12610]